MSAAKNDGTASSFGLPPGTVVYTGKETKEKVKIRVMDYNESKFEERVVDDPAKCIDLLKSPTITWVHVTGVHDTKKIEEIGETFGLHPLVREDIANISQRPKMEEFDDYVFVVCKMVYYNKHKELKVEQVSLVIGDTYVISFHEKEEDVFEIIRNRIRMSKGRIRKMKSDYLAYCLLDSIVDNYFITLEKLGEEMEEIEDEVVKNPTKETIVKIQKLKRSLIFIRKAVWPMRELIGSLQRTESKIIKKSTGVYLRNLYDHAVQAIDVLETYRDMLSGMTDVYLSSLSNRTNEIMKVLTIISTIFIPTTFIASIYGMNWPNIPEFSIEYGYYYVWLVFIIITISMLIYFRKKGWM